MSDLNTSTLRACSSCYAQKPLSEFPLTRGKRFFKCRTCKIAKAQEWAEKNRDRARRSKDAYVAKHPEKNKLAKLQYARSETGKAKSRGWKEANKEHINARYRSQYQQDPTPFAERNRRREERELKVGGYFSRSDRMALLAKQNWRCAGCLVDINERAHADHKTPVIRGGSNDVSNRQMLCCRCNHEKHLMTNEEWMNSKRRLAS